MCRTTVSFPTPGLSALNTILLGINVSNTTTCFSNVYLTNARFLAAARACLSVKRNESIMICLLNSCRRLICVSYSITTSRQARLQCLTPKTWVLNSPMTPLYHTTGTEAQSHELFVKRGQWMTMYVWRPKQSNFSTTAHFGFLSLCYNFYLMLSSGPVLVPFGFTVAVVVRVIIFSQGLFRGRLDDSCYYFCYQIARISVQDDCYVSPSPVQLGQTSFDMT